MPQPYTRYVFYQFTADHQDWYVTDFGADSADFEEVRKNCQEDSHMSGTIELLAGVWRVDEGSRVQIGDNTAVVAIEAHFNAHGAPSGDPSDREVLQGAAAEPAPPASGLVVGPDPRDHGHRLPWQPGTRVWLQTGSPAFTVVAEVVADHHDGQVGDVKAVAWLDGECRITLPWQCWTRVDLTLTLASVAGSVSTATPEWPLNRSVDNAGQLRDELAKKDMDEVQPLFKIGGVAMPRQEDIDAANRGVIPVRADPPFIPGICVVGGCNVPSTVGGVCLEHSNPM